MEARKIDDENSDYPTRHPTEVVVEHREGATPTSSTQRTKSPAIPSRWRRLFGKSRTRLFGEKLSPTEAMKEAVEGQVPVSIFSLRPGHGKVIPSGPVDVDLTLHGCELPMTGKLYYRLGDDFNSADYFWISVNGQGRSKHSFHLPAGIREFRFVMFVADSSIHRIEMEAHQVGHMRRRLAHWYALVRYHIHHPRAIIGKFQKAWALWKRGGLAAIRDRVRWRDSYMEWVVEFDTIHDSDRELIREHLSEIPYQPLISILLPVYNVPERFLRAAIESVKKQLYPNWELCIADDNSPNPRVREVIEEYARKDERIKYVFRDCNGHIAEASNSAAQLATGDFVGLLDHDDELREHALYMVVDELNRHPSADLIFSDEDKITEDGVRHDAYFKSDWNPELLLGHNCVCHFTVIRSSLFRKVQGFRSGFDGAQDWDLTFRVAEKTTPDRIRHIPHVLYHWRVIEGSTAKDTAQKPYVTAAQIKAISEHLERRGDVGAVVEPITALSAIRVRYRVPSPEPLVSLIIPTFNQVELLSQCVEGILNTTSYRNVEIIIIDNRSDDPETLDYMAGLAARDPRVTILRDEGPFNFSRLNNRAVAIAKGEILGFLNNDIQVIDPNWLSEMVSHVARAPVGAVGAKLLFPNGTIQHAGVVVGIAGMAGHILKCSPMHTNGYFCRAVLPQNTTAVTAACMLVKRKVFQQVGGFDEKGLAVAFNDVDLCLKIRQAGHLIVFTPYAELIHHESVSRGYEDTPEKKARFKAETRVLQTRWGRTLLEDPYHNPNFSLETHDIVLGWPPRCRKPWIR